MLINTIFPDHRTGSRWQARHRIVQRYLDVRSGADRTYADWIRVFETDSGRPCTVRIGERSPTISVVLPVYNTHEPFLRAALDSVLEQSYPHWELCIADDCSTEPHVRTILSEYAERDARIRVIYREKNGHISEASNSALSLATGDWIALLDHDDRTASTWRCILSPRRSPSIPVLR